MMRTGRRGLITGAGGALATAAVLRPGAAAAQARRIMVVATAADLVHFDPHFTSDYQTSMLMRNVYDSLVGVAGTPPRLTPRLATAWTISPDGMEYTFTLNPAARFHDGTPVDAAAVKYSFDRLLRVNRGNAWMVTGIMTREGVQVVDAGTLRIRLLRPFTAFLQVLPWLAVVNPTLIEANKGSDEGQAFLRNATAGSGPFRLRRAAPGNMFEFEAVPNRWQAGGGNLGGFIWKLTKETATQRLMVQRGEAHMALDLNSSDMDSLRDRPGVRLIIEPEYRTFSMKMNTRHGPLADIHIRRAISCAFDYQAMLDVAGYATLMVGPLPIGIFGQNPDLPVYRRDLAKAREHLARSSRPEGGFSLSMMHLTTADQQRRWALIMLDSLRALNIAVEIRPMIWADAVASARSPERMPDLFSVYQSANYADPDNIAFAAYHSSRNGGWQNPVYANPEVDDLIDRARSEMDEARRLALYHRFQEQVVADAPDIFGVNESRKLAMRNDVRGYVYSPVAPGAIDFLPLSL
jgi:peptide/nickel transport system substrate-binding protein